MLLLPLLPLLSLFLLPLKAQNIDDTCKNFPSDAYPSDLRSTLTQGYYLLKLVAKDVRQRLNRYQHNELPPNEHARISQLLAAYMITEQQNQAAYVDVMANLQSIWILLLLQY